MTELLVEPRWLAARLDAAELRIVDLRKPENYAQQHVPGAIHLPHGRIVRKQPPAGGLLPSPGDFAALMGELGIANHHRVIAYDDEGGGWAARLIWTLHAYGHRRAGVLDGGATAWMAEGHPLQDTIAEYPRATFTPSLDESVIADFDYVVRAMHQPDHALLDARSLDEYTGARRNAERGGHIPGARHLEWTDLMDRERNLKLRAPAAIRAMLGALGIEHSQEVIVYCQTHHRSALNYLALKTLGFEHVRAYPGSWSEWGNRTDAPVATGEQPG